MNGSIRKRGKSSFEIRYDLPSGADGARRRRSVHVKGSKADAQRRLRELLASLDRGLPVNMGKTSVAEYLQRWYSDYVVPNTRPRTAERYSIDIHRHVIPQLGHIPLIKLSSMEVQGMEAAMSARGFRHGPLHIPTGSCPRP